MILMKLPSVTIQMGDKFLQYLPLSTVQMEQRVLKAIAWSVTVLCLRERCHP